MPRVLLIDTQNHLNDVLKRKFEKEGFDVFVLESGNTPEPIVSFHPDLIVLGKATDALTQVKRAHELEDHGAVPIIMITPTPSEPETLGVGQLSMPFRPSQLMQMARRVLKQPN